MNEILRCRKHVRIVEETQSGSNAISKSEKAKADTKTNTMKMGALSGHGLNAIVVEGQHRLIAMNIRQRIIGTRGKQKGEPMDSLKPCPFCGSEAKIVTNQVGSVRIKCTNIYKCGARQEWWGMEEDAIKAWNRRGGETDVTV